MEAIDWKVGDRAVLILNLPLKKKLANIVRVTAVKDGIVTVKPILGELARENQEEANALVNMLGASLGKVQYEFLQQTGEQAPGFESIAKPFLAMLP